MKAEIEHLGIIERISEHHLYVNIRQVSSCTSCAAKDLCNVSSNKNKLVDVEVANEEQYKVGEEVYVATQLSKGLEAVWYAYCIPLFLLLLALTLFIAVMKISEPVSAILALAVIIVYYIVIYWCRNRFDKRFRFIIKEKK